MASMCILFIVISLAAVHLVHTLHSDTVVPLGIPSPSTHPPTSQLPLTTIQPVHGPELARNRLTPAIPFVSVDADVSGEIQGAYSTAALAAGAGSARRLLHGKRRPSAYVRCNACTIISCNQDTKICTGHCRKRQSLFTCRTRTRVSGLCSSVNKTDPLSLEAGPLDPLHSVEITATAPFIGCANITGLPSGCPADGTRGVSDDGSEFTVLGSRCEQHLYNLTCTDVSRFHPFGYCICAIVHDGGGAVTQPGSLSELDYAAPRLRESDGVPIRVFPEGNTTVTTYGVREEIDTRTYTYDTVFDLGFVSVNVEMVEWVSFPQIGVNLTLAGPSKNHN